MPKTVYDVIVIGTGAGGGMAIHTLCDAGLKVCAINAGRRLNPMKDFRNHRMPYDMKFRGFNDLLRRNDHALRCERAFRVRDSSAEDARVPELIRLMHVDDRYIRVERGHQQNRLAGERILDDLARRTLKTVGAAKAARGKKRHAHRSGLEAQSHQRIGVFVDGDLFFLNRASNPWTEADEPDVDAIGASGLDQQCARDIGELAKSTAAFYAGG